MNRPCKNATREAPKLQKPEASVVKGPYEFDGRENLGTISTTAAGKKPSTSAGKPRTATRLT